MVDRPVENAKTSTSALLSSSRLKGQTGHKILSGEENEHAGDEAPGSEDDVNLQENALRSED